MVETDVIETFFEVCRSGDANQVKRMIENGCDVDPVNSYGSTPLILACIKGRKEVVEVLVENGSNIDYVGPGNWTALHASAFYGHFETTKYLLEQGANINIKNQDGRLPGWDFDKNVPRQKCMSIQVLISQMTNKDVEDYAAEGNGSCMEGDSASCRTAFFSIFNCNNTSA
ncbi:unnamed protein product [Heterosigma akashiwo]|mmetsp:Transcript_5781/g.8028  ORF Transcript_5781/g.8028 Transcript_5781/m.8028 type:complete len:171 (-) Transcript_5781:136-648(-)